MNALSQRQAGSIGIPASLPAEPPMPKGVSHALSRALSPVIGRGQYGDNDLGHYTPPPLLSPQDHAASQHAADAFDTMLDPVTREQLASWLLPINAASRNPQSPQDFLARVQGLHAMLDDLPAAVFTAETRRRVATGFFPSHDDIRTAVEPIATDWRRKRDALRGLRQAETSTPPRPAVQTPAEIEAVRIKFAALREELNARAAVQAPRNVQPRHLHPRQLLAAYEALPANEAARLRAKHLRTDMEPNA